MDYCYKLTSLFKIWFQIEANFDSIEAVKCLYWIKLMTGVEEISDQPEHIDGSLDGVYELLHDGVVLCKLV